MLSLYRHRLQYYLLMMHAHRMVGTTVTVLTLRTDKFTVTVFRRALVITSLIGITSCMGMNILVFVFVLPVMVTPFSDL